MLPSVQLQSIVMDYEAAFWRAVDRVLPDVKKRGCFFHYAQALWRKIQELGTPKFDPCVFIRISAGQRGQVSVMLHQVL